MKSLAVAALGALWAQRAAAHATFQGLWVEGVDYGAQCARLPANNSPITDVTSTNFRCNIVGTSPGAKCPVKAGGTVTIEMHQQPKDRSCAIGAIGGKHWGPVTVYMTKVADAATADGSTGWFKVFQDSWNKNPSGKVGDDDFWGTKDLETCCGRMDVKIPADLPSGDYLLRAEALGLHVASTLGQAQFYMTCYQLTVTGAGGSASPDTVLFPGAYKATDPGILVDIHSALSSYVAPGPPVYAGGSTKSAGSSCTGCESTCSNGSGPSATLSQPSTPATPLPGCTVAKYAQCGGTGYTGCTNCVPGSKCSPVSPPYYSQCA